MNQGWRYATRQNTLAMRQRETQTIRHIREAVTGGNHQESGETSGDTQGRASDLKQEESYFSNKTGSSQNKNPKTGHPSPRCDMFETVFQHVWERRHWIFEWETTSDGILTFVSVKPLDPLNEAPLLKPVSSEFVSAKPLEVFNEKPLFEQHFNIFKRVITGYV